jgi:hypothetical protein
MPDPITYDPNQTVPVSAAMLAEDLRLRSLTVTDDGGSTVNPDDFAAQIISGFLDDARKEAKPAAALPVWADLSDLDKGAALLFLSKRENEGTEYAIENYAARYFDNPALTGLGEREASEHAISMEADADTLLAGDYERLYDLALDADRKR